MEEIWIFIIGAVVGAGIVWFLSRDKKPHTFTQGLIKNQAKEKAERLQKIKDFILEKDKITNGDVQKFLGVSDATAERYLNKLEKEGVLAQKGEKKGVFYRKIS